MITKLFGFKIFILSLINRSNHLIKSIKFQNFSRDITKFIKVMRKKQTEQFIEIKSPFQKMKDQLGK